LLITVTYQTIASVKSKGIIGDKYIQLTLGSEEIVDTKSAILNGIVLQHDNFHTTYILRTIMGKILLSVIVFSSLMVATISAEELSATATLKPVLLDMQTVLEDESLQGKEHFSERRQKIMLRIKQRFDFREMSKSILGNTWQRIDAQERDDFTVLMTKLIENVYLDKLEGYAGKDVEFVDERVSRALAKARVTTLIVNENDKIPLAYIMTKNDSGWMVSDIIIEGLHLIEAWQGQFKSILRKAGYQGLVKVLEEKNRSFLQ
jgi:phospholipid transport system substrate-binding protein